MITRTNPTGLHRPIGAYVQVVRAGDWVVTSGQAALDGEGCVLFPGDIVGQTRATIGNIAAALAGAGAELRDVVRMTVYLADYADYSAMDRVIAEVLPTISRRVQRWLHPSFTPSCGSRLKLGRSCRNTRPNDPELASQCVSGRNAPGLIATVWLALVLERHLRTAVKWSRCRVVVAVSAECATCVHPAQIEGSPESGR
jgi:enamine deaminase RidA (YjgF/YER057c/UK114 family)